MQLEIKVPSLVLPWFERQWGTRMRKLRNLGYLDHTRGEEEHISVGKLVLYRNALSFNHTVHQVSNICSMWTENRSYVVRHSLPFWIRPLIFLSALWIFAALLVQAYVATLPGVVTAGFAAHAWRKFVPSTTVGRFALTVELTSGRKTSFTSQDQAFIARAAHIVTEAIASKSNTSQRIEMNFDNKTINIGRAENTNIIGGSVIDSHVEAS